MNEQDDNHSAWWQDENECRRMRELEQQLKDLEAESDRLMKRFTELFAQEIEH